MPIPEGDAISEHEIQGAIESALERSNDLRGAAVTPFVLEQIAQITEGRNIPANLALAENNARVAAQVAVEFSKLLG